MHPEIATTYRLPYHANENNNITLFLYCQAQLKKLLRPMVLRQLDPYQPIPTRLDLRDPYLRQPDALVVKFDKKGLLGLFYEDNVYPDVVVVAVGGFE